MTPTYQFECHIDAGIDAAPNARVPHGSISPLIRNRLFRFFPEGLLIAPLKTKVWCDAEFWRWRSGLAAGQGRDNGLRLDAYAGSRGVNISVTPCPVQHTKRNALIQGVGWHDSTGTQRHVRYLAHACVRSSSHSHHIAQIGLGEPRESRGVQSSVARDDRIDCDRVRLGTGIAHNCDRAVPGHVALLRLLTPCAGRRNRISG
jgi:hypothetical protein